ncbi:MAG: O-acetylhomoserine aminocarboxypropyltransferase/cysteine synthase, partial [Victivallales bacterium]|nr:O-acetylhomoserine aminocarboxypropyltransferase/cysteine synthase [Victivallales bacterium]
KAASENRIPFAVDSTFTTPYLFKPLDAGADIVIHSMTKWIGGHGTGLGGIVVDGNSFDWKNGNFPLYTKPESSYHNIIFSELPEELPPFITRMRLIPLRNLGACISPDNAWIFLQGIETLSLRMERHSENAIQTADFLAKHPLVEWVNYLGLTSHRWHETAEKYLDEGFGSVLGFGIKGRAEAAPKFIDSVELASHLANVGDAKTLVIHPYSTTHQQLDDSAKLAAGVSPEFIRVSVGIEDIEDIIADFDQALSRSQ